MGNSLPKMAKSADVPSPKRAISYRSFSLFDRPNPTPNARLSVTMVPTAPPNPINHRKGKAVMESQQSTQSPNDQIAELGQRMARMETRMDYVATHEDLAAVRTEIERTHTKIERTHTEFAKTDGRIANLRVEVLKEIGDVKTLIANREASMQRWLLGITSTTMVAITAVLIRTLV